MAGGAKAAAGRARELRARKALAAAAVTCPGSFGVLGPSAPQATAGPPARDVAFLWVDAAGLDAAITALCSRGFELSPPQD